MIEKNSVAHEQPSIFLRMRANPWILSTIVLGILFVVMLFVKSGSTGSVSAVSEQEASQKALAFLNSRVQSGEVQIGSIEKEKGL